MRRHWLRLVLVAGGLVAGCGAGNGAGEPAESVSQPTVYGTDRRVEVYAETDTTYQTIAEQSAVVLMTTGTLNTSNPNSVQLACPTTLGADQQLCTGEAFANEPDPGFCSGTLIDDDLVLTAGHCVTSAADCQNTQIVFNFYYNTATTLQTITTQAVFNCASIVVRAQDNNNGGYHDYAILRLDRAATPTFTPAPVYKGHDAVNTGDAVALIGYPEGIPCKLDTGAMVLTPSINTGDDFVANTDSFAGNSGSGVYINSLHELRGILLQGNADYVRSRTMNCYTANVCALNGCGGAGDGETIGYAWLPLDALCSTAYSARLCCGNGTCESAENATSCPQDCSGVPPSDGGMGPPDSGSGGPPDVVMAGPDAANPVDSGGAHTDAGVTPDATSGHTDAAQGDAAPDHATQDGSNNDGGSADGGPGATFSGCACTAAGHGTDSKRPLVEALFAAMAMLALGRAGRRHHSR